MIDCVKKSRNTASRLVSGDAQNSKQGFCNKGSKVESCWEVWVKSRKLCGVAERIVLLLMNDDEQISAEQLSKTEWYPLFYMYKQRLLYWTNSIHSLSVKLKINK